MISSFDCHASHALQRAASLRLGPVSGLTALPSSLLRSIRTAHYGSALLISTILRMWMLKVVEAGMQF